MKIYWDTSAAINAAVSIEVNARLDAGEHFTRLHLFSEFFSIMTGRGVSATDAEGKEVRVIFDAADAAKWLRDFADKVTLVEVDKKETLDALDQAQSRNVQGARVYDYVHALAAVKARAEVVLTRNLSDFAGLTGPARVEWP